MNGSLRRTLILGIFFLLVLAGTSYYFLLIPRMGEPERLKEQAVQAVSRSSTLRSQVTLLQKQENALPQAKQAMDQVNASYPFIPDTNTVVAQIQAAAAAAGITNMPVPQVSPATVFVIPGQQNPATGSASPSPTPSAASSGASPAPSGSAAPVKQTLNVQQMPVAFTATGTQDQLATFLEQLQMTTRHVFITKITITPVAPVAAAPTTNPDGTPITNPDGTPITPVAPSVSEYKIDVTGYVLLFPPPIDLSKFNIPGLSNNEAKENSPSPSPSPIAPGQLPSTAPSGEPQIPAATPSGVTSPAPSGAATQVPSNAPQNGSTQPSAAPQASTPVPASQAPPSGGTVATPVPVPSVSSSQ